MGDRLFFGGSSYSRLWEKSAIGILSDRQGIALTDSEVVFCRDHRGVDFEDFNNPESYSSWLSGRLKKNPNILREAAVLEALRVPGNKVVLSENFESMGFKAPGSWALRWNSDSHPSRDKPISEIVWFRSDEILHHGKQDSKCSFEWLLHWCEDVNQRGRLPEVLVIDGEQSVVTYRLGEADPIGNMDPPTNSDFSSINEMEGESQGDGVFIAEGGDWPLEAIGIPLHGGRQLDSTEVEIIELYCSERGPKSENWDGTSTVSLDGSDSTLSLSGRILIDLWLRGLNTRSGFKYGTSWRCYSGDIGEGHAPWLVVDPSKEAPSNWSEACLSSRLASGVNKHWIYPIMDGGRLRYLQISRPPSDSRWSNPRRV